MYKRLIKRFLDIMLSLVLLLILLPLFLILHIVLVVQLKGPILYRQVRPGLHAQPFAMHKFRSMIDIYDGEGNLLPDEQRLTAFGKFLRSTSLDELPELFNVLRGDMSLVGPRPLLIQYLERYTPEQARRHEVRPGITGWAQVNGRNAIAWEEKFALDVWYVENQSFWLDMKILFLTLWKVVRREGISQAGQATMSEFMGTPTTSGSTEL